MVALSTIILCFFVLVIIYPVAVGLVVLAGYMKKRRVMRTGDAGPATDQIDHAVDRLKNRVFIISLVIAFFVIAPFLALLMVL
jgi:hypothetical protein